MPRTDTIRLLPCATLTAGLILLATTPLLGQRYSATGRTETPQAPATGTVVPNTQPTRAAAFGPPGISGAPATSQGRPGSPDVSSLGTPSNQSLDAANPAASPAAKSQLIEGGKILARINGELVLAGEILPQIESFLQQNKSQIPESQFETVKRQAMESALRQLIDTKLLYSEFRRSVPEEGRIEVEKRLAEQFDKKVVPEMLERAKIAGRAELDAKMRETGSSLEAQKRAYRERTLARQWRGRSINRDPEISRAELLAYYEDHSADYEVDARARWEEIMVRFDRFSTRGDAHRRLCEIGNEVLTRRVAFADAAKQHSQGFTSDEGGQRDWTTQGALVAKKIDTALFSPSLPVGAMSPILESDTGYHIVRVVERQDAGRTPFVEAQVEIRKTLREQKVTEESNAYLAKLRKNARVWTIFDDEPPTDISQAKGGGLRR